MDDGGMLVTAELHLPRPMLMRFPPVVPFTALLDSGSDVTIVEPDLRAPLIQCGLQSARLQVANVPGLGGLRGFVEYLVGLRLAPGIVLGTHPVYEQSLRTFGYQALIGRDVLEHCMLVYDGPGKRFTLAV